jgi:hypothetical protein
MVGKGILTWGLSGAFEALLHFCFYYRFFANDAPAWPTPALHKYMFFTL